MVEGYWSIYVNEGNESDKSWGLKVGGSVLPPTLQKVNIPYLTKLLDIG
jgi:hypothetical protein